MPSKATTIVATTRAAAVPVWLQLAAAFLLGAVIVYGAGFAQMSAVHNAAHDMRHSAAFPCH
jgi:cobalt transporter subunit CbtB